MAQSAFLTDQQVLGQEPEVADLSRQRRIAELLMAQGMEQPTGQVISGHYVAPSWTQQLAPLAKAAIGTGLSQSLDEKQAKLAEALRAKKGEALATFQELMAKPETRGQAMKYAASNQFLQPLAAKLAEGMKLEEGAKYVIPGMDGQSIEVASGGEKYHAPITIDTGNSTILLDPRTKQKIAEYPKAHQPVAGQVVETANGPMLVNTRTGAAQPIMGAGGQPLAPKLTPDQTTAITSINQQYKTIDGALKAVETTPKAFSFKRGTAQDLPGGETIAGRFDTPEESQARAYVFNNVSAVIKERAGTAQTPGELQRINSFMPGVKDNAQQIKNKLEGFKSYLKDKEEGTRINPNIPMQTQAPQTPQASQAPKKVVNFNDLP